MPDNNITPITYYGPTTPPDVGAQTVTPIGLPASRHLSDTLRDSVSIRDWGVVGLGGDDSLVVYAATTAMAGTGRSITVPGDCQLTIGPAARAAGLRITLDGTGLIGECGRDGANAAGAYGTRGSTILITETGAPAFIVKRNWRLENLIFYWPAQTEAAAVANGGAPIPMPALLAGLSTAGPSGASMGTAEVSAGRFLNNDVINAWDVLDVSGGDAFGAMQWHGNREFFLHSGFKLNSMGTKSFISDNHFTPNAFQSNILAGPTYNLLNYAAANAAVVLVVGNGTASTASANHVDGLQLSNNYVFGLGFGFRVQGGWLNLLTATGCSFDGVGRVLSIEAGGKVSASQFQGGQWFTYTLFNGGTGSAITPAISSVSNSAPGNELSVSGVHAASSVGSVVDWSAPAAVLSIVDLKALGANNGGGTAPGIRFNSLAGRLTVADSMIIMQGSSPGAGIEIDQPLAEGSIVGNHFVTCGNPISAGGGYPYPLSVVGNVSVGTHGTSAYTGAVASYVMDVGNSWDVPGNWEQTFRAADGALVLSYQGVAQFAVLPNGSARLRGALTQSVTP